MIGSGAPGEIGEIAADFASFPPGAALAGSAQVDDGVLKLTSLAQYSVGSFVITPSVHVPPVRSFSATMEILIGGGGSAPDDPANLTPFSRGFQPVSGRGVSFCYADLTAEAVRGAGSEPADPNPRRIRTRAGSEPARTQREPHKREPQQTHAFAPHAHALRPMRMRHLVCCAFS